MHEISSAELRQRAMSGGETARTAFQSLWEAYYRRLSVFAASYRGLPAAERHDAVSDSIIAAFGALKSYDEGRPLSAWVYRIAAIEVTGDSGEGSPALSAIDPSAPGDHAAELVARDLAERCRSAIAALPESDRRIAMLRFHEDLTAVEIGRALGMPGGTIRWRINAIRARIRVATGEETP
jgi:RNA polymerase sigma factor (sigma-70 family)